MLPHLQSPGDLVTYTDEILNEKLHFLCSDSSAKDVWQGPKDACEQCLLSLNKLKTINKVSAQKCNKNKTAKFVIIICIIINIFVI